MRKKSKIIDPVILEYCSLWTETTWGGRETERETERVCNRSTNFNSDRWTGMFGESFRLIQTPSLLLSSCGSDCAAERPRLCLPHLEANIKEARVLSESANKQTSALHLTSDLRGLCSNCPLDSYWPETEMLRDLTVVQFWVQNCSWENKQWE